MLSLYKRLDQNCIYKLFFVSLLIFSHEPSFYTMPFFHTRLRKMNTELLTALEAIWAAETFNTFSEIAIEIPFKESEIKRIAQANDIDFDRLTETVLYENTTVKEYAVSAVEKCFVDKNNNDVILKKRKLIESDIESSQALLRLPQTA